MKLLKTIKKYEDDEILEVWSSDRKLITRGYPGNLVYWMNHHDKNINKKSKINEIRTQKHYGEIVTQLIVEWKED